MLLLHAVCAAASLWIRHRVKCSVYCPTSIIYQNKKGQNAHVGGGQVVFLMIASVGFHIGAGDGEEH